MDIIAFNKKSFFALMLAVLVICGHVLCLGYDMDNKDFVKYDDIPNSGDAKESLDIVVSLRERCKYSIDSKPIIFSKPRKHSIDIVIYNVYDRNDQDKIVGIVSDIRTDITKKIVRVLFYSKNKGESKSDSGLLYENGDILVREVVVR